MIIPYELFLLNDYSLRSREYSLRSKFGQNGLTNSWHYTAWVVRISFAIEFHVHVIFSVSLLFLILEAIRNCIKISNGFLFKHNLWVPKNWRKIFISEKNILSLKRIFLALSSSDLARANWKNQLSSLFLKPCKNRLVKPILEIQNQLRRSWVVLWCFK